MPLIPFPINEFGGLNLIADPTDIGLSNAVDLLNVDIPRQGQLGTRWGATKANSPTLSSSGYQAVFGSSTNGGEILAVRGSSGGNLNIDVLNAGGFANLGSFASTAFPLASTSLGTPTTTNTYVTFATTSAAGVAIRKYDGTTLGTGAGKPLYVATSPASNRLVQGGYFAAADSPTGANGSRSTVFFSDAGAPDTYSANNFVTLRPGDGEVITSIIVWHDLLFVFKQSSVFVFYGESTDGSGNPIFNYRRVDLPSPLFDPVLLAGFFSYAVAGPDGVYVSAMNGIYRTTGDPPVLMSEAISPLFSSDSKVSSGLRTLGREPVSLSYVGKRLIGAYTNAAGANRQVIFDFPSGQWLIWSHAGRSFATFPSSGVSVLLLSEGIYFPNGNDIWTATPNATDDNGSAIPWSYTTGYSNAGGYFRARIISSGERKHHFKTDIEGSGTVTHQVLALNARPGDVADPGGSVTLGTAPAIARGSRRRGVRGTYFAHKLSGSGPAVINGLTYWLANVESDT